MKLFQTRRVLDCGGKLGRQGILLRSKKSANKLKKQQSTHQDSDGHPKMNIAENTGPPAARVGVLFRCFHIHLLSIQAVENHFHRPTHPLEALLVGRVRRKPRSKNFDRNCALQPRIPRAIHFARAARAQRRDDLIRTKPVPSRYTRHWLKL